MHSFIRSFIHFIRIRADRGGGGRHKLQDKQTQDNNSDNIKHKNIMTKLLGINKLMNCLQNKSDKNKTTQTNTCTGTQNAERQKSERADRQTDRQTKIAANINT